MDIVRFSDARIDELINEDLPYIDLTTLVCGIGSDPGRMEYFTRQDCVLVGSEEVVRVAEKLGGKVTSFTPSGTSISAGDTFCTVEGDASSLHGIWKVCLNIFDHLSAIATKTRGMVDAVHAINPQCEIFTTRKSRPGAKDLTLKAILCGGAFPHRLGLSETVLVFSHHRAFFGGFDGFVEALPEIRPKCIEKKLSVEASPDEARVLANTGLVDGVQLDKATPETLSALVKELREINPCLTIVAAGGINPSNATDYANTGVNGLVTTALFTAPPIDMSVRMTPLQ